jgi:hypothetical protein
MSTSIQNNVVCLCGTLLRCLRNLCKQKLKLMLKRSQVMLCDTADNFVVHLHCESTKS